jgi:hypothetical protein
MPEPFATPEDVQARWRTLTSNELVVAEALIDDASDMIRTRWSDVDSRLTSGALTAGSVIRVVANMVKRAMIVGPSEGLESRSQTAGPFAVSDKFANPNANLYFTTDDLRLFEPEEYARGLGSAGSLMFAYGESVTILTAGHQTPTRARRSLRTGRTRSRSPSRAAASTPARPQSRSRTPVTPSSPSRRSTRHCRRRRARGDRSWSAASPTRSSGSRGEWARRSPAGLRASSCRSDERGGLMAWAPRSLGQGSAPVASGAYRDSLHIETDHTDRMVKRVVADVDYALVVEANTGNLARALDAAR